MLMDTLMHSLYALVLRRLKQYFLMAFCSHQKSFVANSYLFFIEVAKSYMCIYIYAKAFYYYISLPVNLEDPRHF